jgi:hypothetical protein
LAIGLSGLIVTASLGVEGLHLGGSALVGVPDNSYRSGFFLAMDEAGTLLWLSELPGNAFSASEVKYIQQAPDGGYVIGYTTSGYIMAGSQGLIRLDHNRQVWWAWRRIGPSYQNQQFQVAAAADGGALALAPGDYPDDDFWATKFSADGGIDWQVRYASAVGMEAGSLWPAADGGYLIAGTAGEPYRVFLMKIDSEGAIVWQHAVVAEAPHRVALSENQWGEAILAYGDGERSSTLMRMSPLGDVEACPGLGPGGVAAQTGTQDDWLSIDRELGLLEVLVENDLTAPETISAETALTCPVP